MEIVILKLKTKYLFILFLISLFFFAFFYQEVGAFSLNSNGIEKEVKPNDEVNLNFEIENIENTPGEYFFEPVNFLMEKGSDKQIFLSKEEPTSFEFANWVEFEENNIILKPAEKKSVNYKLNVPENASKGGHYGAILIYRKDNNSSSNLTGNQVSINGGIAFLNFITIEGSENEKLEADIELPEIKKFYSSIPKEFNLQFKNHGSIHLMPVGNIYIKNSNNIVYDTINANPEFKIVMPKNYRNFNIVRNEDKKTLAEENNNFFKAALTELTNFKFGKYKAQLKIVYGKNQDKTLLKEIKFWVIPWHLLSLVGIILVILTALYIMVKLLIKKE